MLEANVVVRVLFFFFFLVVFDRNLSKLQEWNLLDYLTKKSKGQG